MKLSVPFVLTLFVLGLTQCAKSQDTWQVGNTTLTERDVATGIMIPWEILWGPDDHIWATERRGKVLRIEPESGNIQVILDHDATVYGNGNGEPGMLGMTLHPDFENTPLVYIVYNYGTGFNIKERLVSYEWNGTILENEVILLNEIPAGGIHSGSRIIFTPDGKILMTTGDTGDGGVSSQNINALAGKVLRINPDGSIPADNPDPASYVYSWGHRNAQGLCLGPNGLIYSSEHGQSTNDEFNIIEAGRNYGWPEVEGLCDTPGEQTFCDDNNVREPLKTWSPCIAVNGIEFYNHPAIPEWQNSVLMAVLGGLGAQFERLSVLHMSEDGTAIESEDQYFSAFNQRVRDVCVNPHNGAVYLALNGVQYPGVGPNIIKEFRNLDFSTESINESAVIQKIELWPNPADSEINLQFSESFIGHSFKIISFQGQEVLSDLVENQNFRINISELATGTYYIKASSPLGTVTKTFVVQ
jgi:glucose/arabinose dehydrogenase